MDGWTVFYKHIKMTTRSSCKSSEGEHRQNRGFTAIKMSPNTTPLSLTQPCYCLQWQWSGCVLNIDLDLHAFMTHCYGFDWLLTITVIDHLERGLQPDTAPATDRQLWKHKKKTPSAKCHLESLKTGWGIGLFMPQWKLTLLGSVCVEVFTVMQNSWILKKCWRPT